MLSKDLRDVTSSACCRSACTPTSRSDLLLQPIKIPMSSAAPTTYLVTGANQGLGLGFVTALAKRPNSLIFATARNPDKADDLNALAAETKNIEVVKFEATSEDDAIALAKVVEEKAGKLDVVIANAGIAEATKGVVEVTHTDFIRHIETNAWGPILLFQHTQPLLAKSGSPHFVGITSVVGSLGTVSSLPARSTAYGASKAALSYAVLKMGQEHPDLDAWVVHPGLVQTRMGNRAASGLGFEKAPVTVKDSVAGILRILDEAKRETHTGRFFEYTGKELPW
ncbi:Aflatoxin biosynthesis ketoreductase nor-1 [Rhodotorula toruloides ATCC 204091]|uniref:BY PROTMAP: gi/342320603/gb/EGU12542.1/ Aflatoxin biosynthesis ketoreductase nor-1 [Rhodotorula glutinis ATCC 204091] n=1 Tax=Rhodotorula toruloides TaxID=5286 RepID=A0A0K3CAJ5_RHOTO|nr:Aflatoxin biosynthesis ketoreductase nor-1 [Rhodotorula toruloides ATCC 204091]